jgi:hypothetical protein
VAACPTLPEAAKAALLAVEPEFVAQPDAVAERAPSHVPDHFPHEPFEFFRIYVHSSLHAKDPRIFPELTQIAC